ncbi:hypothetical protein [Saccharopolyspora sp. NPDC050642]|uniref:DUF2017 family protein n=1 Tax=Saccharopolyspora sp. NPDC050642 TaxID=3157099 RepID=UPI00340DB36B
MISWDRQGDRIIVIFSPRQICWLRKHLTDYLHRVDRALSGHVDDPVISNLFGDTCSHELNFVTRFHRARASITTLLDDLPDRGGVIVIRDNRHRMTWTWTLHELRIALATRLGLGLPNAVGRPGRASAPNKLMQWLSTVADTLAAAGNHSFMSECSEQ